MNKRLTGVLLALALICMAAPAMAQPIPFVINGYVFDSNGDPCNDPSVAVTNMNTGVSVDAKKALASNYYRLALSSDDVSDGDVLQFEASGCLQSNTTPHTVTQAEVVAGGFKLNITLEDGGVFAPVITSCDDGGNDKDGFCPGDNVSVRGTGLAADTQYKLWIQNDRMNDSDTLNASEDPSGSQETVETDENGDFGPELMWINISAGSQKNYDIVVDNRDGVYNAADDGIDSASTEVGFTAPIPELPGVVLVSIGLLGLAGLVWRRKDE